MILDFMNDGLLSFYVFIRGTPSQLFFLSVLGVLCVPSPPTWQRC